MSMLTEWWDGLSAIQHVFMFTAIPATLVLIIQTLLLIFGFGDNGADAADTPDIPDMDGVDMPDGDFTPVEDFSNTDSPDDLSGDFRIFTVRGFVAFFAVFGWSGAALLEIRLPGWFASIVAILAGLAAMVLIAWLMRSMLKLQSSGNLEPKNAVGKAGVVYITIPGGRSGSGKVNLLVQERFTEMDAVTDGESIPTGREVVVVGVTTLGTLIVKEK